MRAAPERGVVSRGDVPSIVQDSEARQPGNASGLVSNASKR
jgi:hypothetical protein